MQQACVIIDVIADVLPGLILDANTHQPSGYIWLPSQAMCNQVQEVKWSRYYCYICSSCSILPKGFVKRFTNASKTLSPQIFRQLTAMWTVRQATMQPGKINMSNCYHELWPEIKWLNSVLVSMWFGHMVLLQLARVAPWSRERSW